MRTSFCYLWFCLFPALLLTARPSVSLAEVKVVMDVRACGKAEAAVIFGKSIERCVIYDVATQETKLVVQFCSGVKIGAGVKAILGEAGADASLLFCTTAEITLTNRSAMPKDLLEDPEVQNELKRSMQGELRERLKDMDDEQLKKLHLEREKIENLVIDGFASFRDRSDSADVQQTVESLKVISGPGRG